MPIRSVQEQRWWTWSMGSTKPPSPRQHVRAGRAWSMGSRSWSAKEPPRFRSGPASSRHWRRCAGRQARIDRMATERTAGHLQAVPAGVEAPTATLEQQQAAEGADGIPGLTAPLGRGNSAMFLTDVIVELGYASRERVDAVIQEARIA